MRVVIPREKIGDLPEMDRRSVLLRRSVDDYDPAYGIPSFHFVFIASQKTRASRWTFERCACGERVFLVRKLQRRKWNHDAA